MKLEIIKKDKMRRDIKIEVDKDTLSSIREKVLVKINKEVTIPGFRKGKAPLELVEKKYPDLMREEILKEAIPFYYNQAVKQENLEVVTLPTVKDVLYKDGKLSFVAEVEIRPQVKVEESLYKNIKIEYNPIKVEEEEWERFVRETKEKISGSLAKDKEKITDDFLAKWLGYQDKVELREAFHSEIYLNKALQRRREIEKQIIDTLLSKVKFDIPKSLVEEQKKDLITSQLIELRRRGISEEEVKKHYQEISKRAQVLAEEQIKLYYILEEIAKREGLKYNKDNLYEVVMGFILSSQA